MSSVGALMRVPIGKAAGLVGAVAMAVCAASAPAPARAEGDGLVGLEGDFSFSGANMGAAGPANLHAHSKIIGFADGVLTMHYENQAVSTDGHQITNIVSTVTIPVSKVQIKIYPVNGSTEFVFACKDGAPCMSIAFDYYFNEMKPIEQVQNPELQSSAFFDPDTARTIAGKLCMITQCSN
jgi:hypothetical protein